MVEVELRILGTGLGGIPGASDYARRKYSYLDEVTPNGLEKG